MSTTLPMKPNEFANISLRPVIITIVLSILGLILAILSYAMFTKWCCCKGASVWRKCWEICRGNHKETNKDERPCQRRSAVWVFGTMHLVSKPVLIAINIVYLYFSGFYAGPFGVRGNSSGFDILGLNQTSDLKATGAGFAHFITFISFFLEIGVFIVAPIYTAFYWVGCWKKNKEARSCRKYLEHLRFTDLEFAFILAPFSTVNLFYLSGWWYIIIVAKLALYSVTFAAAVIAGIRVIISYYCCICCECACNEKAVELRSYKQIFVDIGLKMVAIALKLETCSSALATYLEIGILVDSFRFRIAYFSFTMLRGVTALFSLVFTATMLRWSALKEDEKKSGSLLSKILGWLDKHEPHVHVSFFFDMLAYGGLLALNFMIIHGLNNNDFIL